MRNYPLKVGIIGCGAIGSALARAVLERFNDKTVLAGLCDCDIEQAKKLAEGLNADVPVCDQTELIEQCDLIIEATTPHAARSIVEEVISKGKEVIALSTGGLLSEWRRFVDLARAGKARIYLPSGAVCGLDALKAVSLDELDEVVLTTRKPPQGLIGAPYLIEKGIDLNTLTGEYQVFEGSPEEAIQAFPKNINVSATLRLALLVAPVEVKVRIMTSPAYTSNSHQLEARGRFGRFSTITENVPSPDNPKTSFLAILSAIALLKELLEETRIGT